MSQIYFIHQKYVFRLTAVAMLVRIEKKVNCYSCVFCTSAL